MKQAMLLPGVGIPIVLSIPVAAWAGLVSHRPALGWLGVAVLLMSFMAVAGAAIVGMARGVLIDDRNVISLARFQMVVWTALLLSAFVTAALFNLRVGAEEPLAIQIPSEVWSLMGISVTSLVGAPLILSPKKTKAANPDTLQGTKDAMKDNGQDPDTVKPLGQLLMNKKPEFAQWSDMFTGDEASNGAHLDLAKVQMFFFTLLIAGSYAVALWQMFRYAQPDGITAFPALDKSTVALLGISHAGYLVNKAVPRDAGVSRPQVAPGAAPEET